MGEKWDYREMKGFVSNLIGSFPFHKSLSASQNRCWRSGHSLNCRRAEHMLRTNSQKQNQTNVNTHTHTHTHWFSSSTYNGIHQGSFFQGPDYPERNL